MFANLLFFWRSGASPPATVIGPTSFTSTGSRRGLDPGRSTGAVRAVAEFLSTGQRHGIDPERSTGQGA
jgi:hypothetical protein